MQENKSKEDIEMEELHKHIATYSYWLTWGLLVAMFILIMILFLNYYRISNAVEVLWNNTFNPSVIKAIP
jgi:hypothetical protein